MPLTSGPLTQTAWVVPDIAATEAALSDLLGVKSWTRLADIEFPAETCTYRGTPSGFVAHISLAYVGDMQLELIEPVSGKSIYTEFIDRTGGGLHHVCVEVDDLDATLAANELPVAQQGSMADGAIRFAYLDGSAHGVPYLELAQIDATMRGFFDAIKAAA